MTRTLDQLLPHRGSMRFIDRVIGEDDGVFLCTGRLPRCFAGRDGVAPTLGVELGAQAAAASEGWRAAGGDRPASGYLVNVRDARFATAELPADQPLTVAVRPLGGMPPLRRYQITVRDRDGRSLLSATLGTFETDGSEGSA